MKTAKQNNAQLTGEIEITERREPLPVCSNSLLEMIRGGYKSALGGRDEDHTVTIFFTPDDYLAAEALHNAITGISNATNQGPDAPKENV